MTSDLLRLAFGGLHPDRLRELVNRLGPRGVVRGIERGRIETTDHVREAVEIPAEHRLEQLAGMGIAFLTASDPGFPSHVRGTVGAPLFLFVQGRLPTERGVAVVGTRRCTAYGRRIAHSYGRALGKVGIPVVSGLARGIDGAAHDGTASAGGTGVAVMGCGLDQVYPREHERLLASLLEYGGAAVSEYPPGASPLAWRFPPRNRIIVMLAAAVVVVEANVTGGALITAHHALIQGREVLATPGDITRLASGGTNRLIRDGAIPVFEADDLIGALALMPDFGWLAHPTSRAGATEHTAQWQLRAPTARRRSDSVGRSERPVVDDLED